MEEIYEERKTQEKRIEASIARRYKYLGGNIMATKRLRRSLLCFLLVISIIIPKNTFAASINSREKFIKKIYTTIVNRETKVQFSYTGKDGSQLFDEYNELLAQACEIDDSKTSSDADYLKGIITKYGISYNGYKFVLEFSYYETMNQTKKLDTKIDSILKKLDVSKMTDYGKAKAIHDYIVSNVEYDSDLKKFSAYDALFKKSTVCNGYALLFYKMALKAGLECKYITGIGVTDNQQTNHAWNIVKLNKKWYLVDVTWDDPINGTKIYYDYFLKGSNTYSEDHYAADEYTTKTMNKKYPLATTNYKVKASDITMLSKYNMQVGKTKTLSIPIPEKTVIQWSSSDKSIATVSKKGKVVAKTSGKVIITAVVTLPTGTIKELTCQITVKD